MPSSPNFAPNLMKWNLDMNVNFINLRKRCTKETEQQCSTTKYFIKSFYTVYTLIFILVTVMMLQWIKTDTLQSQIDNVTVNIRNLMYHYDRINLRVDRIRLRRAILREFANWTEKMHKDNLELMYRSNQVIVPANHRRYHRRNVVKTDDNNVSDSMTMESSSTNIFEDYAAVDPDVKPNAIGIVRNLLPVETRNRPTRYVINDTANNGRALISQKELRSGRSRRSERRGNGRQKYGRKPNRNSRRLGPLLATFIGAIPELYISNITNSAHIGPWVKSYKDNNYYDFNKFHLMDEKMSIEVNMNGLYLISVQISYVGNGTSYSYWLLLNSEGESVTQKLSKCASPSSGKMMEVSCYTSIVTYLRRGDRLYVQQQEKNRHINLREGYSYIQFVMLSNREKGHSKKLLLQA